MSATAPKRDTLNIRIKPEERDLIDRAAQARGKNRTDFILDTVRQAAEDAMLDQRLFVLDADSWDAFAKLLDAPPEPNPRLQALLARKPAWEA